jgi:cytochrome d ubiquinol oxidase subunit I
MEGLGAFFLESTFLGLWLFGWDRLPKKVHLACIWLVAIGSMLSAAFILAANSWMQHPVGYSLNPTTHQPQLNNVLALFTNPTFLWGYVHVILASLVTGCAVMLAVSVWYLRRGLEATAFKRSAHLALVVLIPTLGLALFVGSELGVVEDKYQPVKIAAAEAQWTTCQPCSFSAFQVGGGSSDKTPTKVIAIPDLLSFLATNSFKGKVVGLNTLQQQDTKQYGPGNYIPNVFIQYWSMRVMAYLAAGLFLLAAWGGWLLHRRRLERSKWFMRIALWAAVVPFLMNTAGWMLTENGRQPWIVQGLMKTVEGVSPSVSATEIWISLIVFVALYLALGAADLFLMLRYARRGLPDAEPVQSDPAGGPTAAPELAY